MKLCTFFRNGEMRSALAVGPPGDESLVDIVDAATEANPGGVLTQTTSVKDIIAMWDDVTSDLLLIEQEAHSGHFSTISISDAKLAPVVPDPPKLLCVAGNYAEHIREGGTRPPSPTGKYTPRFFLKPPSTTLVGSGEPIVVPEVAQKIDWEGELAVVISKRGKNITRKDAYDYVFGYSILNDISERELNAGTRSETRAGDEFFDWLVGKWFDTSAPFGPILVTRDEIKDPHNLRLVLKVNGTTMQDDSTSQMLFDVPDLIEWISKYLTLEPGDVIATGTPAGVGASRGVFLKPGDTVTCEIEHIGCLVNSVEAEM